MAEYFQIPEVGTKVRPGSYFNVDKNGDDDSLPGQWTELL